MNDGKARAMIEEYKATQDMYKHFNVLKWQVGSVLIGAIALVTGFAFSTTQASRFRFYRFWYTSKNHICDLPQI